ncbi:DUF4232 domain-containing protein [Streptomyces sp. NBC_01390]|uniref:DUF4232 domain-containing protein n=1 Tax=Streptomyces sp. NBC_01390 TaxID=2903850 RepID=UPI00324E44F6
MRTTYNSWKACVMGAAALTTLLSMTACDSAGTNNGAGTTPSVPAAPSTLSASPSTTASTRPSTTGGDAATISTSTTATAAVTATATCTEANISIATTLYAHDSARHLLLTATNTGGKKCALYRYPVVRFDEGGVDQVGPMESEMKTVMIGPGEKAYAGMLLFREGVPTEAVERVTVSLQGRVSNADPDSAPIKAPLPAEATFLNIDDNPLVTYWNASRQKAEKYMFGAAGGN